MPLLRMSVLMICRFVPFVFGLVLAVFAVYANRFWNDRTFFLITFALALVYLGSGTSFFVEFRRNSVLTDRKMRSLLCRAYCLDRKAAILELIGILAAGVSLYNLSALVLPLKNGAVYSTVFHPAYYQMLGAAFVGVLAFCRSVLVRAKEIVKRRQENCCLICGYDRTLAATATCPECGHQC